VNQKVPASAPLATGPALIRTGTLLNSLYEKHARALGLTPQQARLLFIVTEKPSNMLGLGSMVHLGKSTMTSLVDRMQELGFLSRTPIQRIDDGCWSPPPTAGPSCLGSSSAPCAIP
jgi:hypothetical protein